MVTTKKIKVKVTLKKIKVEFTVEQIRAVLFSMELGDDVYRFNAKIQGKHVTGYEKQFDGAHNKLTAAYHKADACNDPNCKYFENKTDLNIKHYKDK